MLRLDVVSPAGWSRPLEFAVSSLVLGGYTARSQAVRDQHVEELRLLGIEPPAEVPAFWPVSRDLLTTHPRLRVQGTQTSGEVEFLLLFSGELYVGVGSDQTDRELERQSIPRSKQVCGKVMGPGVVHYEDVEASWDDIVLSCEVLDPGRGWLPYQQAPLAAVLRPADLIQQCYGAPDPPDGAVLMSGTIPLLDGVTRFPRQYRCALRIPGWHEELAFHYAVEPLARPDPGGPGRPTTGSRG